MAEGETKSLTIEPKDAYGARNSQLVYTVERTRRRPGIDLHIGVKPEAASRTGHQMHLEPFQ